MFTTGGRKSPLVWAVHLSVLLLVVLWTLPTAGLFITSFRTADQIAVSGWWTALSSSERNQVVRMPDGPGTQAADGSYTLTGTVLPGGGTVVAWGKTSLKPKAFKAGESVDMGDGVSMVVDASGTYVMKGPKALDGGGRIFFTASTPPSFTLANYSKVLFANGMLRAFINSFTVAVPSTIIPILVAAYAAFALAWMKFPGRALLLAVVVGLLVVPLQLSLIPILRLYNNLHALTLVPDKSLIGQLIDLSGLGSHSDDGTMVGFSSKSYLGIWLAHTGFGLPLAIYLLRNYMVGIPRDIIESSRVDGATDFQIFLKIILPLSFPALASFAIFQFLWTWNDLLVALVFLGAQDDRMVLTARLVNLLGQYGNNWELLTAAAFISIIVPLIVFFSLQRYFVRGLLAGSVK